MRRDFGAFKTRQVLPFYLVCEESDEMEPIGGISVMNGAFLDIHGTLAADRELSDMCLMSLVTYADTAEELMQLTHLWDIASIPGLQARGPRTYGPVFSLLREIIKRDIDCLTFDGVDVARPVVFFLTTGRPFDDPAWESTYQSLVDNATFRDYPRIIAFGVHQADPQIIAKIGTIGAFMGDHRVTPVSAISKLLGSLSLS